VGETLLDSPAIRQETSIKSHKRVEDIKMKKLILLITISIVALGCDSGPNPVEEPPGTEPVTGPVEVQLIWDNAADLDLWVTDPTGERTWYGNPRSLSGGVLDGDDTDGEGPETISWAAGRALDGTYIVQVHHFDGPSPSNYTIRVSHSGRSETMAGSISRGETNTVTLFSVGSPPTGDSLMPTEDNNPEDDAPEREYLRRETDRPSGGTKERSSQ
jgi:hypothetical protein